MKEKLPKIVSVLVATVAFFVLIGWAFDIELFKHIHPSFVAMNPATAIAFILSALSLWLTTGGLKQPEARVVAMVMAAAAVLIGSLKLTDIFFGTHIGIDTVLFASKLSGGLNAVPNRMAPNTAANFVLIGSALLLMQRKKNVTVSQLLCFLTLLLAFVAVIGYVYSIVYLYTLPFFISMAIHTALAFFLMSAGILALYPGKGIMLFFSSRGVIYHFFQNLRLRNKLLVGFGLLVSLSLIFGGLTYFNILGVQKEYLPVRAAIKNARLAQAQMRAVEQEFLTTDARGADNFAFFRTGKSQKLIEWEKNYQIFIENIDTIIAYQEKRDPVKIKDLTEVKRQGIIYHEAFLRVVEGMRRRGFSSFGLEGQMAEQARSLEADFAGNPKGFEHLLQARRYEKNFLLRGDEESIKNFDKEIVSLLSLTTTPAVIEKITKYQEFFHTTVAIQNDIGFSAKNGQILAIDQAMAKIEPVLSREDEEIFTKTDRIIDFVKRLIVSLLLVFTILSIALASFVSREVINQITAVQKAAENIAKGSFKERIDAPAHDEVGVLAATFNTMAANLENIYHKLDAQNATLASKIKELEETKSAMLHLLKDLNIEKLQLKELNLRGEAIIQSIGDGLITTDEYARITKVNKQAERMLGFMGHEIIGKWIVETVRAVDKDGQVLGPAKYPLSEALLMGQAVTVSTSFVRKNNTTFPVSVTASPIMLLDKSIGAIIAFRDITREKELERLKDEFVSVASHELRTPMTAIRGLVSMILEGDFGQVGDNLKVPLSDISHSTQRLIHLVSDMLNVSRIEAGRLKFTITNFDVKETIDSVIEILSPIAKEKKIELKAINFGSTLISADREKVEQILNNIIGNSLKFTDRGGITITTHQEGELLKVYIRDTGTGISSEDQKRLFGKFQQIATGQSGRPPGTGLGLYISRELARKMGGEMWIESSEVGKGSTFAFSIPIANTEIAFRVRAELVRQVEFHPDQKALN